MKLAVFFPGIGYHCDKPLLYFAREMAAQCGYEKIINLSYTCEAQDVRGNDERLRQVGEILYQQAEQSLAQIDWTEYEEILFVSKSIGTAVAAAYAMRHRITCNNIWYTPLAQTFDFALQDGIAFTGTADPWCATDTLRHLCAREQIRLYEYDRAGHSLEVGDVVENLCILQDVMEKSRTYVKTRENGTGGADRWHAV